MKWHITTVLFVSITNMLCCMECEPKLAYGFTQPERTILTDNTIRYSTTLTDGTYIIAHLQMSGYFEGYIWVEYKEKDDKPYASTKISGIEFFQRLYPSYKNIDIENNLMTRVQFREYFVKTLDAAFVKQHPEYSLLAATIIEQKTS